MSIFEIMEASEQKRIRYTDVCGITRSGFVEVFETEYDNDGDYSICGTLDSGEGILVFESDIK